MPSQSVNMMRGLLAEFGINIPEGVDRALLMARELVDGQTQQVPHAASRRSKAANATRWWIPMAGP